MGGATLNKKDRMLIAEFNSRCITSMLKSSIENMLPYDLPGEVRSEILEQNYIKELAHDFALMRVGLNEKVDLYQQITRAYVNGYLAGRSNSLK